MNPSTSIRRPCRSDVSGTATAARTKATAPKPRLNQKMARQLENPTSNAADDRPQGQREARDRGPHAERVGPSLTVRVHVPDDGQGAGLAGRGADPHDDAAGDEPVDVPRQRRHDGATAEDGHADEHDALAAEDVPEHAGHQHETGEGQGIAVDHPLQGRDAGVEIALDIGQADADDRVVQEGEKQDTAQRGQRERLGGRSEPALLDVEAGWSALGAEALGISLRQQRKSSLGLPRAGGPQLASHGHEFCVPSRRVGESSTGCRRERR